MKRNTVAVIGSAGRISSQMRRTTEHLGTALAEANMNVVTGGMDGVMRSVARGHLKARLRGATESDLIDIHPGWGESWYSNPFSDAVVRTDMGIMRNHVVVQAADLIVAIGGKSGTLSEIALGWQLHKPIAALTEHGGWGAELAGQQLDHRLDTAIHACESIQDVMDWILRMRPVGVFEGGKNHGIYPLEVPALHRVQPPRKMNREAERTHRIHARYGMSLVFTDIEKRLKELDQKVADWNQVHFARTRALVTFDDGWRDVLELCPLFQQYRNLQPVVFVGGNHFAERPRPLPLQRLYQHSAIEGADWELEKLDSLRHDLKQLSEPMQHETLDKLGIPAMHSPDWLLNLTDLQRLRNEGWVVASHGHAHENLGNAEPDALTAGLQEQCDLMEEHGFHPWLAWPEGKWTPESIAIAEGAGFTAQFGLEKPQDKDAPGMIWRRLWL